ncbi:hypothetical protein ACHAWF_002355 [Thalassiosira exigua]
MAEVVRRCANGAIPGELRNQVNAAKDAARLLDVISMCEPVAAALTEVKDKHARKLTKSGVADLDLLVAALGRIHDEGRRETSKVSPVGYVVKGYDMHKAAEREKEERSRPWLGTKESEAMWRVRNFVEECEKKRPTKKKTTKPKPAKKPAKKPPSPIPGTVEKSPLQEADREGEVIEHIKKVVAKRKAPDSAETLPMPDSKRKAASVGEEPEIRWRNRQGGKLDSGEFTGLPPGGYTMWNRETLICAMKELEGTRRTKEFLNKVLEVGMTEYKAKSSIYRLYNKWKATGGVIPGKRGRPRLNVPKVVLGFHGEPLPVARAVQTTPKVSVPKKPRAPNTPDPRKLAFTGLPPNGDSMWTRETLIDSLKQLEGTGCTKAFLQKVIEVGRTEYKAIASIYKMYKKYKATGACSGKGRPRVMRVEDAASALRSCSGTGLSFKLKDMKSAFASMQAEESGLDPESAAHMLSDQSMKVALVAVAMGDSRLAFTRHNVLKPMSKDGDEKTAAEEENDRDEEPVSGAANSTHGEVVLPNRLKMKLPPAPPFDPRFPLRSARQNKSEFIKLLPATNVKGMKDEVERATYYTHATHAGVRTAKTGETPRFQPTDDTGYSSC